MAHDPKKRARLTPKQERFCQEYLIDLNATQAAIRAGYSGKGADVTGSKLLGNPRVSEKLQELRSRASEEAALSVQKVLGELSAMAFASLETAPKKFKASDKVKSLELLGKHLGLFKDRVEITGEDGGPVQVEAALDRIYGSGSTQAS